VALRPTRSLPLPGEVICTSAARSTSVERYHDVVRELTVDHSHAKHAALASGDTYMVGSLARLKLWGDRVTGRAREAMEKLFRAASRTT